ncbi:MAG: PD-(D/E)XK nuclease family protein [Lentimicrobiaceae bacterium]|nr:PD-(D/E)XK nuclease family protein [Lentimicrobiaceae bacterium]
MEQLKSFLSKMSIIEYKYRTLEESREQFNIFTVLHKENEERCLHSRFISVLLSPNSTHKKEIFLQYFLKIIGITDFETNSIIVYPTEWNKSEYSNIDILIKNDKKAIIIENKIFAGDSNHEDRGQLEGYFDLIHSEGFLKENIFVFYLTLDGLEPSPKSLGKYEVLENINGKIIDYEHEIHDWLNLCIKECSDQPFLRESILQYINLIKRMTNNIDIKERLEIRDLIASSDENMKSAKLLIENFIHIKWHTIYDFWNELADALNKLGYVIIEKPTEKNITYITHNDTYKKGYYNYFDFGLYFRISDNFIAYVWNGTAQSEYCLFWGVRKQDVSQEYHTRIERIFKKSKTTFNESNEEYSKWFDFEDNYKDGECIYFQNFFEWGTYNLINNSYRAKMINKIVCEIQKYISEILSYETR